MKTYYKYYPRNFANEYIIYSVTPDKRKEFEAFEDEVINDPNRDIDHISYKEAHRGRHKFHIHEFGEY